MPISRFATPALLAAVGLAFIALAEPPKDFRQDPLSGPAVKDNSVPGERPGFAGAARPEKREGSQEIPHRAFMSSIQDALGESAAENLRVSPEQREQIQAISERFDSAQRDFFAKHKDEFGNIRPGDIRPGALGEGRAVRKEAGKNKDAPQEPAGRPAPEMEDGQKKADRDATMERARELRNAAPKPADSHKQIWALLRQEQQAAVQVKLDEFKARVKEREGQAYMEREKKKLEQQFNSDKPGKKDKTPDAAAPNSPDSPRRPAAARGDNERRERLNRLFDQLSPEQRDQLLARLENMMSERGVNPPRDGKRTPRQPGDEKKPAPGMDEVNVPRTDR